MYSLSGISKLLFSQKTVIDLVATILLVAVLFFLFEQYTDYFRLSRLERISKVASTLQDDSTVKMNVQKQVKDDLQTIVFPHEVDALWTRLIAGVFPWIVLIIVSMIGNSSNRSLNIVPCCMLLLGLGCIPGILPEFISSALTCLFISLGVILIFGILTFTSSD